MRSPRAYLPLTEIRMDGRIVQVPRWKIGKTWYARLTVCTGGDGGCWGKDKLI